jgi:hypothetical protein
MGNLSAQGIEGDAQRVFAHGAKTEAPQSPVFFLAQQGKKCAQILTLEKLKLETLPLAPFLFIL